MEVGSTVKVDTIVKHSKQLCSPSPKQFETTALKLNNIELSPTGSTSLRKPLTAQKPHADTVCDM